MPIVSAKPLEVRAGLSEFKTITVYGSGFGKFHYNNRVSLKFVSPNLPVTSTNVIVENPPLPDDYDKNSILKFAVKANAAVLKEVEKEKDDNKKFFISIDVLDPDDGSVTSTITGPQAAYIQFV